MLDVVSIQPFVCFCLFKFSSSSLVPVSEKLKQQMFFRSGMQCVRLCAMNKILEKQR